MVERWVWGKVLPPDWLHSDLRRLKGIYGGIATGTDSRFIHWALFRGEEICVGAIQEKLRMNLGRK
jgi:hypothetical protein